MRNIRIGYPAIIYRLHVGEIVRNGNGTYIHNREGRRTDTLGSAVRMLRHAHHQGKGCYRYDGQLPLPLPSHCRVVCLDVRKIRRSILLHPIRSYGPVILGKPRILYAHYALTIANGRAFSWYLVGASVPSGTVGSVVQRIGY